MWAASERARIFTGGEDEVAVPVRGVGCITLLAVFLVAFILPVAVPVRGVGCIKMVVMPDGSKAVVLPSP